MAQEDYKGIKIYDKILIVEKTSTTDEEYNYKGRTVNQGYVVDVNNKKMLENALSWARWTKYDRSLLDGKSYWDKTVTAEMRKVYDESKQTVDGVVHEYENGKFSITLDEAAGRSTQGGKLSFWNCIITGPDGHDFLVGINSDLLLHLMMTTTLVNGVCQDKVWLGRIKGTQVGVFTENMEDFIQAKKDEETRKRKKTSNYEPGDIVETLTTKELYVGELYLYANRFSERRGWSSPEYSHIKVYEKPKKMHAYIDLTYSSNNINLRATKPARTVVGKDVALKDKMLRLVDNYPGEYMKLRAKEHGSGLDNSYPFWHFVENMAIRTKPTYSQEEIRDDMQAAMRYMKSENPTVDKYYCSYMEDIFLESAPSDEEHVDEYRNFDRFDNYLSYYK